MPTDRPDPPAPREPAARDLTPIEHGLLPDADVLEWVLARVGSAVAALQEATKVEQARDVFGIAKTLEVAVRARNLSTEAIVEASALQVRAIRRMGQLVEAERRDGRLAPAGRPRKTLTSIERLPTLSDLGVAHGQAAQAMRLAAAPDAKFERALTVLKGDPGGFHPRGHIPISRVLAKLNPAAERSPEDRWKDAHNFITACVRLTIRSGDALIAIRSGSYPGEERQIEGDLSILLDLQQAIAQVRRELERGRR